MSNTKTPPNVAATLAKIERNTNRIATAMERLADLFEQSTFVYKPSEYSRGTRYIRVHTSND